MNGGFRFRCGQFPLILDTSQSPVVCKSELCKAYSWSIDRNQVAFVLKFSTWTLRVCSTVSSACTRLWIVWMCRRRGRCFLGCFEQRSHTPLILCIGQAIWQVYSWKGLDDSIDFPALWWGGWGRGNIFVIQISSYRCRWNLGGVGGMREWMAGLIVA